MPQIIPIRDLTKTAKISEMCHKSYEPVYVTKNGYADLVIMSAAVYEAQFAQFRIHQDVLEGLKAVDEGRFEDSETVMRELSKIYAK